MRKSSRNAAKKVIYRPEESFEENDNVEDFEDSGSEASFHKNDESKSDDSSGNEFEESISQSKKKTPKTKRKSNSKPSNKLFKRIFEPVSAMPETEDNIETPFSVKDLTEQEKLLPEFLDLSESDSDDSNTDDLKPVQSIKEPIDYKMFLQQKCSQLPGPSSSTNDTFSKNNESCFEIGRLSDSDSDTELNEKSDITNHNIGRTNKLHFEKLNEHNKKIEEIRKNVELYNKSHSKSKESSVDVQSLLAMGESTNKKNKKLVKTKVSLSSDSDIDDLEEVQGETKPQVNIPKGGIQVVVDLPSNKAKKKKLDLEMMLKRRINRVKKEFQVYMHKVHVLSWIAHGNYINKIINDTNLMSIALSLMPSEQSYPNNRISIKYLEQISKWYADYFEVKTDRNELKFRPKRPPLIASLYQQIKSKKFSTVKNKVLIFIVLLRALGIKCRLTLSFLVVPKRPPAAELCSLSLKKKNDLDKNNSSKISLKKIRTLNSEILLNSNDENNSTKLKTKNSNKIPQLDGADDDISIKKRKAQSRNSTVKRLSLDKTVVKKDNLPEVKKKPISNASNSSYWDEITKDTIQKEEKRISHKDLNISSTSSAAIKKSKNKVDNKKISVTPKSKKTNKNTKNSNIQVNTTRGNMVIKKILKSDECKTNNNKRSENCKQPLKRQSLNRNITSNAKQIKQIEKDNELASTSISKNRKTMNSQTSAYFLKAEETPKIENKSKTPIQKSIKKRNDESKMNKNNTSDYFKNVNSPKDKKLVHKNRSNSDSSDVEFIPTKKRKVRPTDKIDRRVLSSDDEHFVNDKKKKGIDIWCEVYVEEEEQWISVDAIKGQVHCVEQIYNRASHPVTYIVSWNNNGYVKDVTRRYVPHWNTTTRKLRADPAWYEVALHPWMAPPHLRDRREDEQLDKLQLDAPMPKTVAELKNHPLYVLKRHLLKFEVIYPPNAVSLGFVRNEPVYARECVHVCRSRETWVKEAKVVKPNEKPYKIVKARPKYDKLSGQVITDIPLEIFGPWQVDDYIPPKAENGKVPRNPYGNVELFKPCMLPEGTVHLTLPGLNKVAKKLGIDCAPAMVGFDYHCGGSHPTFDGFVVCKEFEDVIIAAWDQDREEAENRAREKIEKRVYGNWRRLIRGLFIRKKLQTKYAFQFDKDIGDTESDNSKNKIKK